MIEIMKSTSGDNHLDSGPGKYIVITTATISCPVCGRVQSLHDYVILADGTVTKFMCVAFKCNWSDDIKLQDWKVTP